MILQLSPPIPVTTPKGSALCHFLIDYGMESDLFWVCFIDETGEIWTFNNKLVRAIKNISMGRALDNNGKGKFAEGVWVAGRLEDAASTLKRLPASNPHRRALTYWPDVVENFWTAYGMTPVSLRPIPPSAAAITRLDETLEWFFYVPGETDAEKHIYRSVLLARAFGISYRKLGRMIGCSKDKAREEWMFSVITLMNRLNNGK